MFPAWAMWIDDAKKAITGDGVYEIICWDVQDNWSRLFVINDKTSLFWMEHYNFGGIIQNQILKFWSDDLLEHEKTIYKQKMQAKKIDDLIDLPIFLFIAKENTNVNYSFQASNKIQMITQFAKRTEENIVDI